MEESEEEKAGGEEGKGEEKGEKEKKKKEEVKKEVKERIRKGEEIKIKDVEMMSKEALRNECKKRRLKKYSKLGVEELRKILRKEMSSQMKLGIVRRKKEKRQTEEVKREGNQEKCEPTDRQTDNLNHSWFRRTDQSQRPPEHEPREQQR